MMLTLSCLDRELLGRSQHLRVLKGYMEGHHGILLKINYCQILSQDDFTLFCLWLR